MDGKDPIWDWNHRASCDSEIEAIINDSPFLREQIKMADTLKTEAPPPSITIEQHKKVVNNLLIAFGWEQDDINRYHQQTAPHIVNFNEESLSDVCYSVRDEVSRRKRNAETCQIIFVGLFVFILFVVVPLYKG